MAFVIADRVKETTTTTGTGTVTLLGAATGFQSFSAIGNANTTYYAIVNQTVTEWEVGLGTYTASGTTLARTTVIASSNAGSAVNFSAGTKDVFVTYPSGRAVLANSSLTSGRVPYATTSGFLTDSANLTFSGTILTAAGFAGPLNGTVGATTAAAGAFTTLSASSTATLSGLTASTALALDASKNVVSVTNTGTGNNVLSASPTLTGTVAGASLSLSSLTSGRVPYATTAGLLTDSANLLYAGANLTVYGLTVGRGAGAVATNTAVGASALAANTTGSNNTAQGYQALNQNTTASNNTAVGYQAMYANTTGASNSAFGYQALDSNTTGGGHTAIGYGALQANTTGGNNTAVGLFSMYSNTTGINNVVLGLEGLKNSTTADYSTVVGYQAGVGVTTGSYNSFFGVNSGAGVTTGTRNTIIGSYQGSAAPISATGSNFIVLSDGDGNVRQTYNSSGALGIGSTPSFGTSGQVLTSGGSAAAPTWTTVSGSGITTGKSIAMAMIFGF